MMTPAEYVQANQALFPEGLVVFYPGSGVDTDPLHTFGSCRNAVFIHADYGTGANPVHQALPDLTAWRIGETAGLNPGHFGMRSWDDFWHEDPRSRYQANPDTAFGIRTSLVSGDGNRAVFVFLRTDGIGTYQVLARLGRVDVLVLQDHGYGGNWDKFGAGGALQRAAGRDLPRWLYVAEITEPWPGYTRVTDYAFQFAGQMHANRRALFRKDGGEEPEVPQRANPLAGLFRKRPPVP